MANKALTWTSWCPRHRKHYADCPCIGPTEDGVKYKVVRGVLYGKRDAKEKR